MCNLLKEGPVTDAVLILTSSVQLGRRQTNDKRKVRHHSAVFLGDDSPFVLCDISYRFPRSLIRYLYSLLYYDGIRGHRWPEFDALRSSIS